MLMSASKRLELRSLSISILTKKIVLASLDGKIQGACVILSRYNFSNCRTLAYRSRRTERL